MSTLLFADVANAWLVAGWTMIHFLWIGSVVGCAAFFCRWILRRSSAMVRYAVGLSCLTLLVALPITIAAWLAAHSPPLKGGAGAGTQQIAAIPIAAIPPKGAAAIRPGEIIELHRPAANSASPATIAGPSSKVIAPVASAAEPSPNPVRQSSPQASLKGRGIPFFDLIEHCIPYLPWLWLIGTPITFALTATGLVGTRRLRRACRPITDGPIVEALLQLAKSLRITRCVAVAVCDRIASPFLIGILRPIILLPPAALTGYSPDEIEMVLLHELAHVRRWDNLVNLMQRLVESLLFFHPAVWLVSAWIRREREACCDALVVTRTDRPHAYAELLVALAAQMPRSVLFHPAATSAMAAGPLRSRIRRILKLDDDPMLVSGKSIAILLASLLAMATLIGLSLPTGGRAEASDAESADKDDAARAAAKFPHQIAFEKGASKFLDGDAITIDEIRGTAKTFEPGNRYWIKGTYRLKSHDRAQISAFTTAKNSAEGASPIHKEQTTTVSHGEGNFTLVLPMTVKGWPHVSYYPADGGDGFGGIFFGTGDSVLKKWWGSEEPQSAVNDIEIKKQEAQTRNNLKNLGFILLDYDAAKHHLPANVIYSPGGKPLLSWRVQVLPFIDRQLYDEFHLNEPWDSDHNRKLIARMPDVFKNPKSDQPGKTNYLAVVGNECVFNGTPEGIRITQVTDGTAQTATIVEADRAVEWTKPDDWNFDRAHPTANLGTLWKDHWNTVFVDGSLHSFRNSKPADEVGIHFTRNGGESNNLSESAFLTAPEGNVGGEPGTGTEGGPATSSSDTNRLGSQPQRSVQAVGRKIELKPDGTMHAEGLLSYDPSAAAADAEKASSDHWPMGVAFPSPKEGEISARAWRELGLKVIPASKAEQSERNATAIKVVGGVGLPPNHNVPVFLLSLNKIDTKDFDQLDAALKAVQGQKLVIAHCVTHDSAHQLIWIDVAIDAPNKWKPQVKEFLTPPTSEASENKHSKFPSLEDQRLADVAWKRLNLELEPIGEADLKRVKALGYDGGLKVVVGTADIQRANAFIQAGDILVGLHAWPTTTMKDLAQILSRDDIGQLSPLKFYVVRRETMADPSQPSKAITQDSIRTGRINVNLGGSGFGGGGQSSAPLVGNSSKPNPQSVNPAEAMAMAQRAKNLAMDRGKHAQGEQEVKAAKDQLEKADRQFEDARLELQKAKQIAEVSARSALDKVQAAMKVKQEALRKRQQAEGQEAIEAAERELERANRQLEDAQRQLEKEMHGAETGDNTQATPGIKPRPPAAESNPNSKLAPATNNPSNLPNWHSPPLVALPGETTQPALPKSPQEYQQMQAERMQKLVQIAQNGLGYNPAPRYAPVQPNAISPTGQSSIAHDPWLPGAKASNEELDILRDQVKTIEEQLKFTNERLKSGTGATELDCLRVGCDLALAQSDLALAEGEFDVAVSKLGEARKSAEDALKVSTASFQAGAGTDYSAVIEAKRKLADIKLKLIRLQRPPYVAPLVPPGTSSGTTLPSPPRATAPPSATGNVPAAPNDYAVVIEQRLAPDGKPVYESRPVPKASTADQNWTRPHEATNPKSPYTVPSQSAAAARPADQAKPDNSALRYDGKTFDEWRTAWRTELSTEKRAEAVKALAAFGANGYGKEAAAAILEITSQYDWWSGTPNNTLDSLRTACVEAFGGEGAKSAIAQSIPANDSLPVLSAAATSGSRQQKLFLGHVLPNIPGPDSLPALLTLSRDTDPLVRRKALSVLPQLMSSAHDDKVAARVREALASDKPDDVIAAMFVIVPYPNTSAAKSPYPYLPELMKTLYSTDEKVRRHARELIRMMKGDDAVQVTSQALAVLKDESKKDQHIEAIRALAAVGPKAGVAIDTLRPLMKSENQSLVVAAAGALKRILGQPEYTKLFVEELRQRFNLNPGGRAQSPEKEAALIAFERAVRDEETQLFPH